VNGYVYPLPLRVSHPPLLAPGEADGFAVLTTSARSAV